MKGLIYKIAGILLSLVLMAPVASAQSKEQSQTEKNKEVAIKFYNMIFNEHKVEEAFKLYSVPDYKQHNPYAATGAEPAIKFLGPYMKSMPESRGEIKRVIAEGEMVAIHNHVTSKPGDRGRAVVDIFRVVNGRVVEHWDVVQDVPEKSANENTMF